MKLTTVLMTLMVSVCILASGNVFAAFNADGDISDWGVDISQSGLNNVGYFDTYTPTNALSYLTEDNVDNATGGGFVGPAYSIGNSADVEAMYFNYEGSNIYVAIVSGVNPETRRVDVGDLFLDTGNYQTSTTPQMVNLGTYNPAEAWDPLHRTHKDNEYEYAFHFYDLGSSLQVVSPKLYQLDKFTIPAGYPVDNGWTWNAGTPGDTSDDVTIPAGTNDIVGTEATGEPTALLDDLRFGSLYYQVQSGLADPWAVHYLEYMAWVNAVNAGVDDTLLPALNIDTSVVHALSSAGLDFGYGAIGNEHYLYEFQIPMASIGWDPTKPLFIHWTTECGNDELDLIYTPTIVPEPATVTLLGLGLLGAGAAFRKRKNRA